MQYREHARNSLDLLINSSPRMVRVKDCEPWNTLRITRSRSTMMYG